MFTGLKRLARNKGGDLKLRFFNQESEDTVPYILLSVKWLSACSEVGEIIKYTKNRSKSPHFMVPMWE